MKEAVATMVVRDAPDGHEVLLLQRATQPFLGEWFPVEGAIDTGEDPDEAVLRELREETQLAPSAVYRESTRIVPSDLTEVRLHIYVAFVTPQDSVILNEEHAASRWCSLEEALRLLPLPAQRAALARVRSRFLDSTPPRELRVQ
jgi:8-oxo-dGTP pyrophosphatase MutT (NUDIX family)